MNEPPKNFETTEQAEARHKRIIRRFEDYGHLFRCDDARDAIAACDPEQPCRSGACPLCLREYRLHWNSEVQRILRDDDSVYRLSLVPDWPRPKAGKLRRMDLKSLVAAEMRALQRLMPPGVLLLAGVDFSFNVRDNGPGRWQPHIYAVVVVPAGAEFDRNAFRQSLTGRCAPKAVAARPLILSERPIPRADWPNLATYALKPEFYKRSEFTYFRKKTGKLEIFVKSERLPAPQATEAACFVHRYGAGDRLLLIGVKRHGPKAKFVLRRD